MPRKTAAELAAERAIEEDPTRVTLARARSRIGSKVVYLAAGRPNGEADEVGVIMYVGETYVMVDYGKPGGKQEAKATYPNDLRFLTHPATRRAPSPEETARLRSLSRHDDGLEPDGEIG